MKGFKEGDYVEVKTSDSKVVKGIVMPGKKEFLEIKLDSGYNIGIDNKKIKEIKILKHFLIRTSAGSDTSSKKEKKIDVKEKKNLKKIVILHCGGTFASKVSYETGAVKAQFKPEEIIEMFPELKEIINVDSRLIRNMFSEDMNFNHYNLIAKEIEKEIKKGCDGIIITHGTDTLHYTASALSFILDDLTVPVILVGAQRSSDRGSSDAFLNLICAAKFIAESDFCEVAVCMHENMNDESCLIMPGTKVRKLHSSRREAFKVVNGKAWARVSKEKIEILDNNFRKREKRNFKLKLFDPKLKVGILRSHPNMHLEELKNYEGFDGLVLEGTGLGHFPINEIDEFTKENTRIYEEIKRLCKKTPVVMASQTVFGRVDMNVYDTGRKLIEAGVLGNYSDMTTETSFIKLAWLLSNYKDKVREYVGHDFRGEIGKRSGSEFLD